MKYNLKCVNCGKSKTFEAPTLRRLLDKARDEKWVISRDYSKKWCPDCGDAHRHPGRRGNN